MSEHRQRVWRTIVYIRALGGEPLVVKGLTDRNYAAVLQQQYEGLLSDKSQVDASAARLHARELISRKGLKRAAEESVTASIAGLHQPDPVKTPKPPISAVAIPSVTAPETEEQVEPVAECVEQPPPVTKDDLWNCWRKIRHHNYLTAIQHAHRLGNEGIHVYPCNVCGALHVGHDPDHELTRRYRKAGRRLRVIEERLLAINRERRQLEHERNALLHEQSQLGLVTAGNKPELLAWETVLKSMRQLRLWRKF